jgi:hypothetical protein
VKTPRNLNLIFEEERRGRRGEGIKGERRGRKGGTYIYTKYGKL